MSYEHPTPEDFDALGFVARQDAYRRLHDEWVRRMALDEKAAGSATRNRMRREAYGEVLDKLEDFVGALRSVAKRHR